jgi:glutamate/tyrosine decarboxylase-like PLP-dependent enzyme
MAAPEMKPGTSGAAKNAALERAADYGLYFRHRARPLHPTASTEDLRKAFCTPLPQDPTPGAEVIERLIAAAEPGLVGNTDPNFYAWVMGGSDETGVAADWLTSIWGQNAAIFQTSPAAAIAEEAVAAWLLELLDLPRESSVGLVTGATMASFVGLAAARQHVLARIGYDIHHDGLQAAPLIRVFFSDDAHVANEAALRYLGFGEANFTRVASDANGLMDVATLGAAMSGHTGPKIVIGQAGHINSGGFEDFVALSHLAREHDAWLHVDGAFGLWACILPEKGHLVRGIELADSWSVDGHKWLQIPYDSGFAIVRHAQTHRGAMSVNAGYLNYSSDDGRNPTDFNPELSRRARGFAAWATMLSLGKSGVRQLVGDHCDAAKSLCGQLASIAGLQILGSQELNQVVIGFDDSVTDPKLAARELVNTLNAQHSVFVKTALWKGRHVVRCSITTGGTDQACIEYLARSIRLAWKDIAVS